MENNAKQILPVLPKGQGSFSYYKDDLIMFRKVIIDSDVQKVRKSVYAKTVTDCFKKMNGQQVKTSPLKLKGMQNNYTVHISGQPKMLIYH